jgi:hypothetical protein
MRVSGGKGQGANIDGKLKRKRADCTITKRVQQCVSMKESW